MIYIVDLIVLLLVLYGALRGWKYGGITTLVNLIGTIFIFILAYYLKNPVSVILYENLPFINFGGVFDGFNAINILLYEALAFVLVVVVLSIILAIILRITKFIDKLINMSLILTLPNKLLGLVFGAIQYYIMAYFVCFILLQIPFTSVYLKDSKIANTIVKDTPALSDVTEQLYNTYNQVYDICVKYQDSTNKEQGDYEAVEALLKNNVIETNSVIALNDKGKIEIDNIDELIKKYKE